jgi:translocation and assembly module TamB
VATRLGVVIDAFTLPPGGSLAGRLDGALALNGTWPQLLLGGRVALSEARIRLPEAGDPTWEEIRIHGLPEEAQRAEVERARREQAPSWVEPLAANVVFEVAPSTWVEGQGIDLRVTGDVRVLKKSGEQPLYVGAIRTLEGAYRFRDRRFDIERGVATLAGTRELDPELDVVATQRVRGVELRVLVSGRASAPDVTLESDPPLDPSDQLSYLAFGQPVSSLGTSDAARLESAATSVVTQLLLGSGAAGSVLGALPLDRFQFETGTGESGRGVAIGAEVVAGVTLSYERDFATDENGARVEWRFHPRWRIQSEIDESGETGADLIWNYEF